MKRNITVEELIRLIEDSEALKVDDDFLAYAEIRDDDESFMVIVNEAYPDDYHTFEEDTCNPFIEDNWIVLTEKFGTQIKLELLEIKKL